MFSVREPGLGSGSHRAVEGVNVNQVGKWVGSVWSHRQGRVLIGRLRAVQGNTATLAVVGLGPVVPDGLRVLPPEPGGCPVVQVPLLTLLASWKRMGSGPGPGALAGVEDGA
jgi:hypothetical protein